MFSEDDENCSLFGSPSPSRSPSPALALPTKGSGEGVFAGSSATNIAQNVGTIALPGSHHYSELPDVSLALPLSCPLARVPPTRTVATALPSLATSSQPSPTRSRASSTPSSSTTSGKKKKQKKRKQAHPSPAPSIALPDPSVTPPPNFFRNQSALLGTAGLVAGLKPARMQFNIPRGATPTNPIVLDDDDDPKPCASSKVSGVVYVENEAPKLGKRSGSLTPSLDINPALLPAPTNKEIVAMLLAHKDIYPILRNILRLIAGQKAAADMAQKRKSARPSSTPITTGPRAPPLKRRRLNRVPAGAVDWDVPYPFQEGEGPEQYRKVWEKERRKQLISQLLDLVRIAARKAAIRKYLQQQEAFHRAQRAHSAPASLHGVANQPVGVSESTDHALDRAPALPHEASQASSQPHGQPTPEPLSTALVPPQPFIPPEPAQETSTSLDQLISSLLATTAAGFSFTDSPSAAHGNANPSEGMNDGLIDSWMDIFQTFPVHPDDLASTFDTFPSPTQSNQQPFSVASTLGGADVPFFDTTSAFNFDSNMHSQSAPINDIDNTIQNMFAASQISAFPPQNTSQQEPVHDLGLDHILSSFMTSTDANTVTCDATLSAISQPQPKSLELVDFNTFIPTTQGVETSGTPESTFSMPSASSIRSSSADPSTPASAVWESTPDVAIALPGSQHLQEPSSGQGEDEVGRFTAQEKQKWPEREHFEVSMDVNGGDAQEAQPSSVDQSALRSHSLPAFPGQLKLSNEDIMRLAQERRQELIEELECVKTRLWETTIEQGVLAELQKQLLP
ncbi:hypothetical protein JOM56_001453 [Amanita muscaria]